MADARMKKPTSASLSNSAPSTPVEQHRHKSPIADVRWVDPKLLRQNSYNPNHVFGPEMDLLKLSLLADGWTQPVVVTEGLEIVDGFHRWTLASTDLDVAALGDGLVPVVILAGKDYAARMASTVRHNRARGQHGILAMGEIVRGMAEEGLEPAEIEASLGMEPEERERLEDTRSSPTAAGLDDFGRGWVPDGEARKA